MKFELSITRDHIERNCCDDPQCPVWGTEHLDTTLLPQPTTPELDTESITIEILFDGPPGTIAGRFIEVEDTQGRGIKWGDWVDRGDGTWALIGPAIILMDEQDRSYERQGDT